MPKKKRIITEKEKINRLVSSLVNAGCTREEAKILVNVVTVGAHDGVCCAYCGKAVAFADVSIDHSQPVSRSGTHNAANLYLCCKRCNIAKGNLTGPEFNRLLDTCVALDSELELGDEFSVREYVVKRLYSGANMYRRFKK